MGEDLIILRDLIDEYKKAIIKDRRICVTEPDIQALDNILFDYKQKLKALDKSEELIKQLGGELERLQKENDRLKNINTIINKENLDDKYEEVLEKAMTKFINEIGGDNKC